MTVTSDQQPRIHDYTRQAWGHGCTLRRDGDRMVKHATFGEVPVYKGHLFGRVQEGDEVLLKMQSGRNAIFTLTKVDRCRDPQDMYFIEATPARYED